MDRTKLLVYRLVSGYDIFHVDNNLIKYVPPRAQQMLEAELFYEKILEEIKFNSLIKANDINKILLTKGVLTPEEKKEYDGMPERLKEAKKILYEDWLNKRPALIKAGRGVIKSIEARFSELWKKSNSLRGITMEENARQKAEDYLLDACVTVDGYPLKYFKRLRRKINMMINSRLISNDEYRKVGLDRDFQFYIHNDYFKGMDLSTEQISAILMAKGFINAMNSTEPPTQEVLEDKDLFDGWIYYTEESRDIKRKKDAVDASIPTGHGQQAVFVPAKNAGDVHKIHKMNDSAGKVLAGAMLRKK